MGFGNSFDDGQPQPGPSLFPAAGGIGTVKTVKYIRNLVRRNAGAAILHLDTQMAVLQLDLHQNTAVFRRVDHGIGQQIVDHLADTGRINRQRRQTAQQFYL